MGLGLDAALQEGLISLLEAALVMGGGLLLLVWAASSRYFEVLFILAAFAILAYAAHQVPQCGGLGVPASPGSAGRHKHEGPAKEGAVCTA